MVAGVTSFVGAKVEPQAWEKIKRKCLLEALFEEDMALVSVLMEEPGFDVNATFDCDCEGSPPKKGEGACLEGECIANTLLHAAMVAEVGNKRFDFVKKLFAFPGIDINAKDGNGDSVLMVAVTCGFPEVVRLLLAQKDIDLNTRDKRGMTLKNRCKEVNGIKDILMCLKEAERDRDKRQEEIEEELESMGKEQEEVLVGLGKGRNARRRKNKEKHDKAEMEAKEMNWKRILGEVTMKVESLRKTKEERERKIQKQTEDLKKVFEKDKESENEKMRTKLRLLEGKEEEEKLKIKFLVEIGEQSSLALADKVKMVEVENGALQDEMKEIEIALEALLRRKSRVVEKQKSIETKVASMKREETILKQNLAAQVEESEAKVALVQIEIKTVKLSLGETGGQSEKKKDNTDLEKFLEVQILELESELECPVCLEVATTSPIYKCLDDHLLCRLQ